MRHVDRNPRPVNPIDADAIARGLRLRRSGRAYTGACPRCRYKGAFSVEDGDNGAPLVRCHAGCDQGDLIATLRDEGLWPERGGTLGGLRCALGDGRRTASSGKSTTEEAISLWKRAGLGALGGGETLAAYLAHRGCTGPIPPTLRYLADARHRPTGTRWPAMVAAVTREPTGAIVAVHRTYLRRDGSGKAPVDPARMTLGPIAGGAVRLAAAGERLCVAEGIETSLSVQEATGLPTWSALNAGNLRELVLPPLPLAAEVTICADHDPVGLAAARDAAARWHHEGRTVRLAVPPALGSDFNDILTEGAAP